MEKTEQFMSAVQSFSDSASGIYSHGKEAAIAAANSETFSPITTKVNEVVTKYPDPILWCAAGYQFWSSPSSFVLGIVLGLGKNIANRMSLIDLKTPRIITDANKIEYSVLTTISLLVFTPWWNSLGSGFFIGDYISNSVMNSKKPQ